MVSWKICGRLATSIARCSCTIVDAFNFVYDWRPQRWLNVMYGPFGGLSFDMISLTSRPWDSKRSSRLGYHGSPFSLHFLWSLVHVPIQWSTTLRSMPAVVWCFGAVSVYLENSAYSQFHSDVRSRIRQDNNCTCSRHEVQFNLAGGAIFFLT